VGSLCSVKRGRERDKSGKSGQIGKGGLNWINEDKKRGGQTKREGMRWKNKGECERWTVLNSKHLSFGTVIVLSTS
jgi:hypothetical protein